MRKGNQLNWGRSALFAGVLASFVGVAIATTHAQSAAARQATERVRNALEALPSYGVFDFVAFQMDRETVTLMGYAYQGTLKADATKAVRDLGGISEVGNRIELLPASQHDDRIR